MKNIILLSMISIFFIACGSGDLKKSGVSSPSSQNNSDSNDDGFSVNNNNNNNVNPSSSANGVVLFAATNSAAQTNCSSDAARFESEVRNVDRDILACAEFELNLPTTAVRYGETHYCDQDSKFVTLNDKTEWTYVASLKTYVFDEANSLSFIRTWVAPGRYRQVIKEANGTIHRGQWITFARSGAENCAPSSSSTKTKVYYWSAIVAGPVSQPTKTCNESNLGEELVERGYTWTCSFQLQ